ncbi:MAG: glucosaminidase domain-containing protein [Candidatus Pacebacteria bacterium]|nr:glucosaminidase domain-containing protein [Candidatus Paceibacterota bacterium]
MKNKNTKLALNALILFPVFTGVNGIQTNMLALNGVTNPVAQIIQTVSQDEKNIVEQSRIEQASRIDEYFGKYNLPLEGYGMKFVLEAEKNNLDWRLLPAIAMRESTGGKFACGHNPFGWGSCKISFETYDNAIETVAWNLGGNNPRTERYYKDKTISQIIDRYNPPHIVAGYKNQIWDIMEKIETTSQSATSVAVETDIHSEA